MNNPKILLGFYSATQARLSGTKRYQAVNGRTVELTCVSETEDHGCKWPDVVFVSEVLAGGFIEQAAKGEYAELDNLPFEEFVDRWKEIYQREERQLVISSNPKKWN